MPVTRRSTLRFCTPGGFINQQQIGMHRLGECDRRPLTGIQIVRNHRHSGVDFFYQFKLSDHLSRGNASYIADGTYNGPYYRISLHRRHNNLQHRRLRQLAATQPNVYYVAPEFDTLDDFKQRLPRWPDRPTLTAHSSA